jgi:hypothetical protein
MRKILNQNEVAMIENNIEIFEKEAKYCPTLESKYLSKENLLSYARELKDIINHLKYLSGDIWCRQEMIYPTLKMKKDIWNLFDRDRNFVPYDLQRKFDGSYVPVGYSKELIISTIKHGGKLNHYENFPYETSWGYEDINETFYYVCVE